MTKIENLPPYLQQHGLFCLWKYETRNGKTTKPPYNPNNPQYGARANDRSTFAPLAVATSKAQGFNGLGVGIFGDLAGIDIDHCIDQSGKLSRMAQDIVDTMDAYTEISPSGTGIRILFLAPSFEYDAGKYYTKNSSKGLEVYVAGATNRYLTVTGNVWWSVPDLEDRTDRLQLILDRYMLRQPQDAAATAPQPGPSPVELPDLDLIARAQRAKNGAQFSALWAGDFTGFKSQSEADLALCNQLAFWTGKDPARMDQLFRQSGLFREKWDRAQSGTTYGAITIQKAIDACQQTYAPGSAQSAQDGGSAAGGSNTPAATDAQQGATGAALQLKTAEEALDDFLASVQTEDFRPVQTGISDLDQLLEGGFLRQSLVILSAAPGTGKTTLAQQMFENMAANGTRVVYLNLEMSREQLLARSISRLIWTKQGKTMRAAAVLKGYKWTDEQRGLVLDAAEDYRSRIAPNFDYNPAEVGNTYQAIGELLKRYGEAAKSTGIQAPVVVLDYLHLLSSSAKEDAQETIKNAVQMLKKYALDYRTFVFALSATNRSSNASGKVTMESGRDSSGIEYTADYLLGLNYTALIENEINPDTDKSYRADNPRDMEKLQKGDANGNRRMTIQILKSRMGPQGGRVRFAFDTDHSTFTSMSRRLAEAFQPVPDDEDEDNPFIIV